MFLTQFPTLHSQRLHHHLYFHFCFQSWCFQLPSIGHILSVQQVVETEVGTFSLSGRQYDVLDFAPLTLLCFFVWTFYSLFGYGFALDSLNVKYDYNYFVYILMLSLSHNFTISVMLIYRTDCIGKNQY